MAKKLLKVLLIIVLVIVVAAGGLVGFLTATEYRPDDVEYISANTLGEPESIGDTVRLVTWNVGYCGLGENEDFVMDGGTGDGSPSARTLTPISTACPPLSTSWTPTSTSSRRWTRTPPAATARTRC